MRKYAIVQSKDKVKKIMIYEADQEVYLFTYETIEDLPCCQDYWFETLVEAEDYCKEVFGEVEWIRIEDPREGDQQDLIGVIL
ncbi:hypothetical protein [Paenibacillus sp. P46E]|uniref:hypothetical protein n=1 Tax=Paenibacillus sp. P46E TaxID=1349436 RepID=UPI0009393FEC|nr:hypothetical protein [Paenibacillus sp. P46E]OKP97721.1 hypothetical protein A3849_13525 [Paenibacillus sp. P46E]